MTAFNVVRVRVKPGCEDEFIEAHRRMRTEDFPGSRRGVLVKTGEHSYCVIGEWESMEALVAARPQMQSYAAGFRDARRTLEVTLASPTPYRAKSSWIPARTLTLALTPKGWPEKLTSGASGQASLIQACMLSARSLEPTTKRVRLAPQTNGERVRGIFQLPKFSVIIWVRKTDEFEAIRNDLVSLVGDEPFESTEYEGTVDLHWGFKEHAEAKQVAESLREISQKPEILLLRVSSLDDAITSFSLKDERRTRH